MSARRSSRIAQNTTSQRAAAVTAPQPGPSKQESPKKRQRIQKATASSASPVKPVPRRRRVNLECFKELPLDVLAEVLKYLGPGDLLSMSRTTKGLRAMILDQKYTGSIWMEALSSLKEEDPSLPLDSMLSIWSPIKTTDLLFGRNCMECGKVNASLVETFFPEGVRFCRKCFTIEFTAVSQFSSARVDKYIRNLGLARTHGSDYGKRWYLRTWHENIASLLNKGEEDIPSLWDDVQACTIKRDISHKIQSWHDEKLRVAKAEREAAYKAKVVALGFGDEILQWSGGLSVLPGYCSTNPRPLTEKEWAVLEPRVIQHFEKSRRMKQVRFHLHIVQNLYREYRAGQPGAILPGIPDLVSVNPFRDMVWNSPLDQSLDDKDFKPLMTSIPSLVDAWKQEAALRLLRLVPHGGPSPPTAVSTTSQNIDTSSLARVTTLFRCLWCSKAYSYPFILMHECLLSTHFEQFIDANGNVKDLAPAKKWKVTGNEEASLLAPKTKWNEGENQVAYGMKASRDAKSVVIACGLDPETATSAQMDALEPTQSHLECLRCHKPRWKKASRLVMTWRAALEHQQVRHPDEDWDADQWGAVSLEDLEKMAGQESVRI